MSVRADDRIWWCPPGWTCPPRQWERFFNERAPVHRCPQAVWPSGHSRDSLDPMALGTCRYCGEKLP